MNKTLSLTDGLGSYFTQIGNIPLLTTEEERELVMRIVHDNDMEAARKLVISHLRFVVYIAKRYKYYGLPLEDLIQEGNISLMQAVDNYDPVKHPGVKFASYAVFYIKGAIRDYVVKNWKPLTVATTKAQLKLFHNLKGMKTTAGAATEEEAQSIAKSLNVSVKDVRTMEERMYATHLSFSPVDEDDTERFTMSPERMLYTEDTPETLVEEEQYQSFVKKKVMHFIDDLTERNRDIILSRKFTEPPVTLLELSKKYDISLERIRQLENNIIKKMKKMVEEL